MNNETICGSIEILSKYKKHFSLLFFKILYHTYSLPVHKVSVTMAHEKNLHCFHSNKQDSCSHFVLLKEHKMPWEQCFLLEWITGGENCIHDNSFYITKKKKSSDFSNFFPIKCSRYDLILTYILQICLGFNDNA